MKNLMVVRVASLFSLSLALMFAVAPVYADNKLYISGELTNQTCILSVDGSANGNPIVNLEPVHASNLKDAGSTAGRTEFTLSVSGCIPTDDAMALMVNLQPYYLTGPNNDFGKQSTIGNIGSANNVDLHILHPHDGTPIYYDGPNISANAGLILVRPGETSGKTTYSVEYVSHQGGATPGTVVGRIQYAISYL
ncbi:type 1 fimbrial protein [Vibrio sp. V31_P5A7T61]|uniref:fimbrial protein n=1 Tax=Vibrio sp. V31_P5A7T61 TaxID=1938683 RepID=UPI00137248FD|nr:fimbrial protein [Vibrio sp. V31_P5A7T61]NAW62257.1 type 1 fimbrial protein [Vibrio sp. V31_P5A7T61]